MNQSLCQDLECLLANKNLVHRIFLATYHRIIIIVFLPKTIQINFKDLKTTYLFKIFKLKIVNLVKPHKVLFNKQAQDNSKQILFKIWVQQNKSFQKWILKVYLANQLTKINQFWILINLKFMIKQDKI